MTKHFSTLKHNVWLPYRFAVGPVFQRFYEGLREEKILGNQCPRCHKILVPARTFCPECHVDMDEWREVSQEGEIVSWILARKPFFGMPAKPPFIAGLIRLDGVDCRFLHLIGGLDLADRDEIRRRVKKGSRVRAVWRKEKEGHLLDIEYFEIISWQ